VGRLNHVAIAVPNLREAAAKYRDVLGVKVSEPQALPAHGVTVAFVDLGNTKLELLEPLGAQSPIAKFLEKNAAGGIHHICLEVDDIQASAAHTSQGARLLDPQPKLGAHGTPVVFLHPKDMCGVLTELEEVKR
jgi:methylmalonyl-CoA/ethylmalonyl-CoA epimerase